MPRHQRYRPVVRLGSVLAIALALCGLMNLLAVAALAWPQGPTGRMLLEAPQAAPWPGAYRLFRSGAVMTRLWVFTTTLVLWLVWNHRVVANLAQLQAQRPRYRAARAVWSWFVPVLNLLWPFQVLQQVWLHSAAAAGRPDADQRLLNAWWLVWIALPPLNLVMPYLLGERDADGRRVLSVWGVVTLNGAWLVAALLAVLVVLRVTRWQDRARPAA